MKQTPATPAARSRAGVLWSLFSPAPPAPVTLKHPAAIDEAYRRWRQRVLLTTIVGYASTLLSGWGLGLLVQKRGWDAGFVALAGMSIIGTLLFAAAWKAKAHGYAEPAH